VKKLTPPRGSRESWRWSEKDADVDRAHGHERDGQARFASGVSSPRDRRAVHVHLAPSASRPRRGVGARARGKERAHGGCPLTGLSSPRSGGGPGGGPTSISPPLTRTRSRRPRGAWLERGRTSSQRAPPSAGQGPVGAISRRDHRGAGAQVPPARRGGPPRRAERPRLRAEHAGSRRAASPMTSSSCSRRPALTTARRRGPVRESASRGASTATIGSSALRRIFRSRDLRDGRRGSQHLRTGEGRVFSLAGVEPGGPRRGGCEDATRAAGRRRRDCTALSRREGYSSGATPASQRAGSIRERPSSGELGPERVARRSRSQSRFEEQLERVHEASALPINGAARRRRPRLLRARVVGAGQNALSSKSAERSSTSRVADNPAINDRDNHQVLASLRDFIYG